MKRFPGNQEREGENTVPKILNKKSLSVCYLSLVVLREDGFSSIADDLESWRRWRGGRVPAWVRGLCPTSRHPADPQGLHRPTVRVQAGEPRRILEGVLPEAGKGKLRGLKLNVRHIYSWRSVVSANSYLARNIRDTYLLTLTLFCQFENPFLFCFCSWKLPTLDRILFFLPRLLKNDCQENGRIFESADRVKKVKGVPECISCKRIRHLKILVPAWETEKENDPDIHSKRNYNSQAHSNGHFLLLLT